MDTQDDQWSNKLNLYHSDNKGTYDPSSGSVGSNEEPRDNEPRAEVLPQGNQGSKENEDVAMNHIKASEI